MHWQSKYRLHKVSSLVRLNAHNVPKYNFSSTHLHMNTIIYEHIKNKYITYYLCIHNYIYKRPPSCIYPYTHTYSHTVSYTHSPTFTHTHTHTHTHLHPHTHTHLHSHHTHTHTHTPQNIRTHHKHIPTHTRSWEVKKVEHNLANLQKHAFSFFLEGWNFAVLFTCHGMTYIANRIQGDRLKLGGISVAPDTKMTSPIFKIVCCVSMNKNLLKMTNIGTCRYIDL